MSCFIGSRHTWATWDGLSRQKIIRRSSPFTSLVRWLGMRQFRTHLLTFLLFFVNDYIQNGNDAREYDQEEVHEEYEIADSGSCSFVYYSASLCNLITGINFVPTKPT